MAIKQGLFRDLEALCSPTTLFASNTSSLSITAIAGALQHPARMAGLHFFNPAPLMELVGDRQRPGDRRRDPRRAAGPGTALG